MFGLIFKRRTLSVPENAHQVLLSQIGMIRSERMNRVFSSDNSTNQIQVTHRSILDYNQYLKYVIDGAKGPGVIDRFLFRNSPFFILFRDWFIYENHYLNIEEQTEVFKVRALELVEFFIKLEQTGDAKRLSLIQQLGPVISLLRNIVQSMVEVSKFEDPKFRDPRS